MHQKARRNLNDLSFYSDVSNKRVSEINKHGGSDIKGMYIRGFTKFGIKVLWRLQFFIGCKTFNLKFQKTQTQIEVVLSLPS